MMSYRMQSQDCWYWMPVAVAVAPWIVSDSRCTVRERSEVKHKSDEIRLQSSLSSHVLILCYTVKSFSYKKLLLAALTYPKHVHMHYRIYALNI